MHDEPASKRSSRGGCTKATLQLACSEKKSGVRGQQTSAVMAAGRRSSVILLKTSWIIHLTFPHSYITSIFPEKGGKTTVSLTVSIQFVLPEPTLGHGNLTEHYGNGNKLQSSSLVKCNCQWLKLWCRIESKEWKKHRATSAPQEGTLMSAKVGSYFQVKHR